ncbi:hypothetical protein HWB99_gp051 [Mycobacterium phage DrLupo]|uniref:Uncharacterized protein n=1 Tax=Mycobacterium phage DrLupo TaxID=2499037 RepID=A0A3S9UQK8_9CAUD|nr:hypothetical protein HWB99_gp051 [Mycobacterium phage DrLupo]AZS12587.1 hypothetical protein SEA_DRLUPO_51 [Mycobacterium phage DrLupo]
MKSTPIHTNHVGDCKVSTVFIEPWRYYETAILRKGQAVEVRESGIISADDALIAHEKAVELAEKALRYRER